MLPNSIRLNQRIRGVQGADWVHRMMPNWTSYEEEIKQLGKDNKILEFLNEEVIKGALSKIEEGVRPEFAVKPEYKILMRSLIVYRFIKKFA